MEPLDQVVDRAHVRFPFVLFRTYVRVALGCYLSEQLSVTSLNTHRETAFKRRGHAATLERLLTRELQFRPALSRRNVQHTAHLGVIAVARDNALPEVNKASARALEGQTIPRPFDAPETR